MVSSPEGWSLVQKKSPAHVCLWGGGLTQPGVGVCRKTHTHADCTDYNTRTFVIGVCVTMAQPNSSVLCVTLHKSAEVNGRQTAQHSRPGMTPVTALR